MSIGIGIGIGRGKGSSLSSLFTELIDGIPVSMIKRVRTKDAVELYCVDLKLTDTGFPGVEDTDFELIYGVIIN